MILGNTSKAPSATSSRSCSASWPSVGSPTWPTGSSCARRQCRGHAPGLPAQRDRLRDDRPDRPGPATSPRVTSATVYAPLQAAWTAGGVAAYVITLAVVRRSRDLDRYRYLLLASGVILLLLPLVPGLGRNIQRLSIQVDPPVPAGRDRQDRPLHLLRLLLRRQAGAADHPDGPAREPPRPRPPSARPHRAGLDLRHPGHEPRTRHRLLPPSCSPSSACCWVTTGRTGVPGARTHAVRHRGLHHRQVLLPDARQSGGLARSVGPWPTAPAASWSSPGTPWATEASGAPGWASARPPTWSATPTPTSSSP